MTLAELWTTIDAIENLSTLDHGWDNYGAEPINRDLVASAKGYLVRRFYMIELPPKVVPMTGGRLQFEWVVDGRELELEFADPSTIRYLAWQDGRRSSESTCIVTSDQKSATDHKTRQLLDWLFGRTEDTPSDTAP